MSSIVDAVFRENFVVGYTYPIYDRDDDRPDWKQQGDPLDQLVEEITGAVDYEITRVLTHQLIADDNFEIRDGGEPFYDDTQLYEQFSKSLDPHSRAWAEFKQDITYNRRFFNELAVQRLDEIFRDIHFQSDIGGQRAVYQLKPEDGKRIFRVRQIDDARERTEACENPAVKLGVPPQRKRTAGRMNASGVGVFYGSFDLSTCIAEVRPTVGCIIVGAEFEIVRPIVVLDTTRFAKSGKRRSLFSPVYYERLTQWKFMTKFMREISRPVLPDDTALDYIPTQAVSEFISSRLKVPQGKTTAGIDAIIFASAQRPDSGLNIVLFGDAASVEQASQQHETSSFEVDQDDDFDNWTEWKKREENPALRVVENTIVIKKVTGVQYGDEQYCEWDQDDTT